MVSASPSNRGDGLCQIATNLRCPISPPRAYSRVPQFCPQQGPVSAQMPDKLGALSRRIHMRTQAKNICKLGLGQVTDSQRSRWHMSLAMAIGYVKLGQVGLSRSR